MAERCCSHNRSTLFHSKVKQSDHLKALVVTTSDQGQLLVVKCQTGFSFPGSLPCCERAIQCTVWAGSFSFFVAKEALLCQRETEAFHSNEILHLHLASCARTVAKCLLQVPEEEKAPETAQRKVSSEWKCQMQRRQPLLSPESRSCMHGHFGC